MPPSLFISFFQPRYISDSSICESIMSHLIREIEFEKVRGLLVGKPSLDHDYDQLILSFWLFQRVIFARGRSFLMPRLTAYFAEHIEKGVYQYSGKLYGMSCSLFLCTHTCICLILKVCSTSLLSSLQCFKL